ncbi:MAG TPA: cupin domain-containing protein [Terriglobales bacterium]|nr:cupin domain-containing protein [Terriglobales bacterium]
MNPSYLRILFIAGILLPLFGLTPPQAATEGAAKPRAKVIPLQSQERAVSPILTGPPETVTMKSGYVVLPPGKSVGKHSTEQKEEILIVLEGQGEMIFSNGSKLPVKANTALYCPPQTEHNVSNTGTGVLRYVYVVANAREDTPR